MRKKIPNAKPVHGTKEWATKNVNFQTGCEHNCRYCYAKAMAIRFKRATPLQWPNPALNPYALARSYPLYPGQVMFPSTHDITPVNIDHCLAVLLKLLVSGNRVLIVSKPHFSCIKRLCLSLLDHMERVLFRFTIGAADDKVLSYWEPGAPPFQERLECLKTAFRCGFKTSVSCEPMLDGNIKSVIDAVRPYVADSIWLGRVNHLRNIIAINEPGNTFIRQGADDLIALHSDDWIRALYGQYRHDPIIKWKDSIKQVVGLGRTTIAGQDT